MPEPQDIEKRIIEGIPASEKRVPVEKLKQAIINLEEWARKRIEALDRPLTAEDYNIYIGPTTYDPRKL